MRTGRTYPSARCRDKAHCSVGIVVIIEAVDQVRIWGALAARPAGKVDRRWRVLAGRIYACQPVPAPLRVRGPSSNPLLLDGPCVPFVHVRPWLLALTPDP